MNQPPSTLPPDWEPPRHLVEWLSTFAPRVLPGTTGGNPSPAPGDSMYALQHDPPPGVGGKFPGRPISLNPFLALGWPGTNLRIG